MYEMNTIEYFNNYHEGQRCFILGSGPSIGKQNISLLQDQITFCSNWFVNHEEFGTLNTDYYCAYDTKFIDPEPNKQWIEEIDKYEFVKFFPDSWGNYNLPFSNSYYVPYRSEIKIYENRIFSADLKKGFFNGDTVIINMCIPLAMLMGFKEIILLGCDCDYHITDSNKLESAYFYDMEKHYTSFEHDLSSQAAWQDNLLTSYKAVHQYAIENEIQIFNATLNGKLDVFPRVLLEDVV